MKWAGLAGGIGCGKSTVAALLGERGAISIDVDLVSRSLQQPGQPVFGAMVARWGARIVAPDGTLDRPAVAAITFEDKDEMAELMTITSDAIDDAIAARVSEHASSDRVVLLESALLGPSLYGIDGLIVVDAPEDVALERLERDRGMEPGAARARMAHQPTREQRRTAADFLVDNGGDHTALQPQITLAWDWLQTLPDGSFRRRTRPSPRPPRRGPVRPSRRARSPWPTCACAVHPSRRRRRAVSASTSASRATPGPSCPSSTATARPRSWPPCGPRA
jgi:dephospho-CoA kinase